ncbi:electron transfer flavoprotein subunit beta/FixA family protein [Mycolicibacterium sp. 050158]|jgi:electron transfer flavoprotein beta subunit|uniref:electron transfer flavoprotein subunit beta/FixA family protein n=1 Tax=Mycolicibacterium sp. 050158 TaxID=3090602 RepID=UPI00299F3BC9|nr:electron transfer flavoprotein subunit beta/FixA family protein [Mycolicibacterium sp. 050158]MDX1889082.1 electron transfer flavoprotein subunit beta/FixA family protein [Mycolicibacterium sp. 050158]
MTNIVVLIKQVPDYEDRKLTDGDWTLDRAGSDPVLDEINEKAVEVALQLKEKHADADYNVVVLTAGPAGAETSIRRALSMGADSAYHLADDGLAGSDLVQTSWALARALGQIEDVGVVIAGNETSDGVGGAVPAILAQFLGLPQLTHMRSIDIADGKITGERETDDGVFGLEASLPAIVSISEKIVDDARFPSFKGIMAAKKKPVESLTLAGIGVEGDEVGLANAATTAISAAPKPPKSAGEKVTDEGEGGKQIADYLVAQKLL